MKTSVIVIWILIVGGVLMAQAGPIELRRDPFAPAGSGASSGSGESFAAQDGRIKVTGIIWDLLHPFAIVVYQGKKQVLSVGDAFDGKRVVEITPKYVTVQFESADGGLARLRLEVGKETTL